MSGFFDTLEEIRDLCEKAQARLAQSETLGGPRFLGLLFKAPDEDGKRAIKFFVNNRRHPVSRKMYYAGKEDTDWIIGVILDRDQRRVDAYGHREFRDGERDPLHLQSR